MGTSGISGGDGAGLGERESVCVCVDDETQAIDKLRGQTIWYNKASILNEKLSHTVAVHFTVGINKKRTCSHSCVERERRAHRTKCEECGI